MAIWYCLPVRLSVMVSVSAMKSRRSLSVVVRLGGRIGRFVGHAVILGEPAPKVRHLAPVAAEWPPPCVDRLPPAVHTERLGACQTLLSNREAKRCVNRRRVRLAPSGLRTGLTPPACGGVRRVRRP